MSTRHSHTPVLLQEALDALDVKPDATYVDGTFGRGGHTRALLARLGPAGRVVALDRDLAAVAAAGEINDARLRVVHASFARLREVLSGLGIDHVAGILLDLGMSSAQLDDPQRGFSFQRDGPLDMRMDTSRGQTAAHWLAHATEGEIREVVWRYGEERFAKQIAAAIVAARARHPVASTRQLASIVAAAVRTREVQQNPATRTFQALRIHINQELEELSLVLAQAIEALAPTSRLVVISFHSLEDRIVKRFMRDEARPPSLPARLPVRAAELPPARLRIVGKPVRASAAEVAANPRARSAVLRVAERLDGAAHVVRSPSWYA